MTTSAAVMNFMSFGFRPSSSAAKMIRRYSTAPTTTAATDSHRKRWPRIAWPMITDARPMRIRPTPIELSAKPWYCANTAPAAPTRPLDSARVISFVRSVDTPKERIIGPLSPVARTARPKSVLRNHTIAAVITATTAAKMPTDAHDPISPASRSGVKMVSSRSSGTFDDPMIRRFTDHRPICVKMPASSPSMLPLVWSKPVINPAAKPVAKPARMARKGFHPARMATAAVAPPVVKEPSTVRSAKLRMRNVRNTPRAITP